jgi:ABC-type uncharacterized transport system, permease component
MAKSLGIHTDATINVGLMISNGLVGLCGALVAQSNGYADVNMGIGTIVIALASIIIGEVAFGDDTVAATGCRNLGKHHLPLDSAGSPCSWDSVPTTST